MIDDEDGSNIIFANWLIVIGSICLIVLFLSGWPT